MKACTFFGHRDAPEEIEPALKNALLDLIEKEGIKSFYIGTQGRFDAMARKLLSTLEKTHGIRYAVVLAYPPDQNSAIANDTHTIYPEGLETTPKRYAVVKRNRWMLEHSTHVITYVRRITGGASAFKQLAGEKSKTIIAI